MYEWQSELLGYLVLGLNVIVLKSRQVGASWIIGAYIIWLLIFFPSQEVIIYSIGDREAISLLRKIKFMLRSVPRWMYDKKTESQRRIQITTTKIDTETGERVVTSISSVDSFPSSSNAGRGETPNFIFYDEHDAQQNSEAIWAASQPALQHGGQCATVSTLGTDPNSVFMRVFELAESGMIDNWQPMRVHYTRCGLDREWVRKNSVGFTPAQIMREYEMKPTYGDNPVFSPADLAFCYKPLNHPKGKDGIFVEWNKQRALRGEGFSREIFEYEYDELMGKIATGHEFYTGVDSSEGKHKDQNSVCTLNEYGVQIACDHNNLTLPAWAGYTTDDEMIVDGFVTRWHREYPGYLYIEENGPGLTVYNNHVTKDETGMTFKKRAHDNVMRTGLKTRIINNLVLMVAGRLVTITDPKTYEQLLAYQIDEKTGKMGAPNGRLDDAVMSLAWAAYALDTRGVASFEMQAGRTGGDRIFSHSPGQILRVGSMQDSISVGNAPRESRSEFGIDTRVGNFDMDRVRSLR